MMVRRLRKYFISGLAVFLPLSLAIYVFVWIMNFAEGLLGKYLKPMFLEYYNFYFWGLGILFLLTIVLFCGFLVTHYFGKALHRAAERVVLRVPLLGSIYPAFKEIAGFLFRDHGAGIQQVVMVEWPGPGAYVLGFLTNASATRLSDQAGRKLFNVMIPKVPNPLTGFVVMLPEERFKRLEISVEEALKIIVSGGVMNGEALSQQKDSAESYAPSSGEALSQQKDEARSLQKGREESLAPSRDSAEPHAPSRGE